MLPIVQARGFESEIVGRISDARRNFVLAVIYDDLDKVLFFL